MQMVMGALKLGQYVRLVPLAVTSGFMTGIGCIIISCQLLAVLGATPAASTVVSAWLRNRPSSVCSPNSIPKNAGPELHPWCYEV